MEKLDINLGYSNVNGVNIFKVWSPIANKMKLCIYRKHNDIKATEYEMNMDNGVWKIALQQDLEGMFYTFKATINGEEREGVDPYAKGVSVNGIKGAIIDINKTNPNGWENHKIPERKYSTDSIIYEISVRDLSSDENSGITNKGKFLALAEENTIGPNNVKTGLSHIKELGVTHVQLLPIYDFHTIDEEEPYNRNKYNWGYDPQNYNVPEGSYSTDPFNPYKRIKELKEGIKVIHENGMSVIMDVVYNHMYDVYSSGFNKLMPGYYFRYNEDGTLCNDSMCGNALASEKPMCRKFIVDSVLYWANEYKIDGFRFDLMGLLDVKTLNEVREELNKIDPNIIVLGEGWNMESYLKYEDRAVQGNAYKLKDIAFFNDGIRDALRGNPFSHTVKGFLSGEYNKENDIKKGIVGAIKYSDEIQSFGDVNPNQNVNYAECHDNHTLFDKLHLTVKDVNEVKYLCRLGTSIVLLSQGIPFLHGGQDFLRTKRGVENSYNSPDFINSINWIKKSENLDTVEYIKGLISLRKKYSHFRMRSVEEIKNNLEFINSPLNSVAYKIYKDEEELLIVHNASKNWIEVDFGKYERYETLVNKEKAGVEPLAIIEGDKMFVEGQSTTVLVRKKEDKKI